MQVKSSSFLIPAMSALIWRRCFNACVRHYEEKLLHEVKAWAGLHEEKLLHEVKTWATLASKNLKFWLACFKVEQNQPTTLFEKNRIFTSCFIALISNRIKSDVCLRNARFFHLRQKGKAQTSLKNELVIFPGSLLKALANKNLKRKCFWTYAKRPLNIKAENPNFFRRVL